jgi:hypothetical protein
MLRIVFTLFMAAILLAVSPPTPAASNSAPTFHDCTFLHRFGKIVHVVYCPAAIPPSELASFVIATKGPWLAKYGFVQYRFFSTKENVPKDLAEMMNKSDAWFEKYEIGSALFNQRTGAAELWCKKATKADLTDCTSLLK